MAGVRNWSGASVNTITGAAYRSCRYPRFVVALLMAVGVVQRRAGGGCTTALHVFSSVSYHLVQPRHAMGVEPGAGSTKTAPTGGKDWRERHLAARRAALGVHRRARGKCPGTQVRVFVMDARCCWRAARAIFIRTTRRSIRAETPLRLVHHAPGDLSSSLTRRGIQLPPRKKSCASKAGPVSAEAVLVEPGAGLFRII
jgi:hypothetical protein